MYLNIINNYFIFLFSFIPLSLVLGSSISLLNILLIDISFLFFLFYLKDFSFLKNKAFQFLLLIYIYLIFNSLISVDQSIGISRNFGFIRIIIFFVAVNYFFRSEEFSKKVFLMWFLMITIVLIDVLIESFSGRNIFGWGSSELNGVLQVDGDRIVSFFKDEPIVGGFLNAFYLIIIGFLNVRYGKKNKNFILIISFFILFCIFLTGERSNSIKALLGITFFYMFFREYQVKNKIFLISGISIFILGMILSSDYLKMRYIYQIKSLISNNQLYFKNYISAYYIFKDNKLFGVGNKNYRIVACSKHQEMADKIIAKHGVSSEKLGSHGEKADKLIGQLKYTCITHPHQIYFELLSEHGIFGTILILYLMYKLVLSKILFRFKELNYIQIGSGLYITFIFLPLIPSGSFFTDYSITLFALNLGIFYATNMKFNIFLLEKNN